MYQLQDPEHGEPKVHLKESGTNRFARINGKELREGCLLRKERRKY